MDLAKTEQIIIKGARQHNLKNIDLNIPKNQFVVITGVSGSGKSSLAFDTIFAEGQRRYVESLSTYARQFLGQLDKADVDSIEGLSPAISIDQKSSSHNPRSTVGTVTEIYDFLRILYARIGTAYCVKCHSEINPQTIDEIIDQILTLPIGTKIQILAPIISGKKGLWQNLLKDLKSQGFARIRIDGEILDLDENIDFAKNKKHNLDLVVDRLIIKENSRSRLTDSTQVALKWGNSNVLVNYQLPENRPINNLEPSGELIYSEQFACSKCNISFTEISPRIFSFNSPYGACIDCHGLGYVSEIDPNLVVPDKSKSISNGAIYPWAKTGNNYYQQILMSLAKHYKFSLTTAFEKLNKINQDFILYGSDDTIKMVHDSFDGLETVTYDKVFEGVINNLKRRYEQASSDKIKAEIENYMTYLPCTSCNGKRLKPESLSIKVNHQSIADLCDLTINEIFDFFSNLDDTLTANKKIIAKQIIKEISVRLKFLLNVGLDYLNLSRRANSLSGGEAQRIRLATQIGSGLSGVLYVLDEPSIGLHQRDNDKLISTLKKLRDLGNTLIVVEHDEDTIKASDYIIDIGPLAGLNGGKVVASGNFEAICESLESLTGAYLSQRKSIHLPKSRRTGNNLELNIINASLNNLKNICVTIPLNKMVAITGVSGSGKSTLINDLLLEFINSQFLKARPKPIGIENVLGLEHIDKVIQIDQAAIGRTPRSNTATYTGLFDHIREVFAQTTEAKIRGYEMGRFSFNVKGGRCEACKGEGMNEVELNFLPSVYIICDICKGARYNRETLEAKFKNKSIAEVLEMTVDEAIEFFSKIPKAHQKLLILQEVGLGYIKLGQSATTLSGGEAQRVKLANQLAKRSTGKTLYILDEPTTGLSFYDVDRLLNVLQKLVDLGNTVIVIEHNLDVIKQSDWIIDLGPEGGNLGGQVIATGTPEDIIKSKESYTGIYLKKHLKNHLKTLLPK